MGDINTILLTEAQQTELREWEQLFASPGWQRFSQTAVEELKAAESAILTSVENDRQLYFYRGQRVKLLSIVGLQSAMEAFFESLTEDAALSREEEEESFGSNA